MTDSEWRSILDPDQWEEFGVAPTDKPIWDTHSRLEFFRDTFRTEIVEGGDELAMFARLVCVLGEPARLLAELRVGMGERSEDSIRTHAAVGLEYTAAACLEIADQLRNPTSAP